MPSLNEAEGIGAALEALRPLRERGHEVIVSDGGSTDGTPPTRGPRRGSGARRRPRPRSPDERGRRSRDGPRARVPARRHDPSTGGGPGGVGGARRSAGMGQLRRAALRPAPGLPGHRAHDLPSLSAERHRDRRPGDLRRPGSLSRRGGGLRTSPCSRTWSCAAGCGGSSARSARGSRWSRRAVAGKPAGSRERRR